MRILRAQILSSLLCGAAAAPAAAAEIVVPPGTASEITVYNGDYGLVREHRKIRLGDGQTQLAFTGMSRGLQAETAALQVEPTDTVKPADVKILDQTFAFNLLSQQALLEQAIGKEVTVVTPNTLNGRETTERAKVLSVQSGLVLDIAGKIHTGVSPSRIVFDSLPPNLRPMPTLLMTATGPANTDIPVDLNYLTGGLNWRADYVATYDSEGGRLDLTAWATITNTTGVEFKDAKLKLAAGDINRVTPPPQPRPMMRAKTEMMTMAAAPAAPQADGVSSQTMAGLNLYTIARPVTLAQGESKQFALLRAVNLPVKREFVVRGQPWFYTSSMAGQRQDSRAEIEVTLKNEGRKPVKGKGVGDPADAAPGLGVPLPAGILRAYGQEGDDPPQFLGEDRVDHTAEGGEIRLHLGRDLELPVVREQTSFVKASETIALTVWRVTLRNAKSKPTTVKVSEPISGNWEIPRETLPHTKSAAGAAEWQVTVPPKGEAVLEYTVKTTF